MDLRQLLVFQAAVKGGGFTRAGEALHLSQSAVSQHIRQLEDSLGGPLFLRVGKAVKVNEAGSVLFNYTERIFRDLKNAEMAVRELSASERGTIRFGVDSTTLTYRLSPVLAEYKQRFPEVELIVLAGSTDFLMQAMKSRTLDLSVVMYSRSISLGMSNTPLGREEMVVILNRGHRLARKNKLNARDLASLRFILSEKDSATRSLVTNYFEQLGVTPRIIMEVENHEAIKSLVAAGLGASILPFCAVSTPATSAGLHVTRVRGVTWMRQLALVSVDAEAVPRAIQALASSLVAALAEPLGKTG